ncbi:MAG: PilZ domain-containing protein [Deltaproteobacteria bacterium]|nr:PilZ domain-containing protein [Deltaproteobacteria bacterium]
MSRLPALLKLVALLYGGSAAWCVTWLAESGDERAFFFPATILAVGAIPIAWGLIAVQRAAFIWMYIHVAAWLAIAAATSYFVKDGGMYLWFAAAHAAVCSLPFLKRNIREPFVHGDGRGFREKTRHDINLKSFIEFEGQRREGETMDLSERGAYVSVATDGLEVGQRIVVQMHLRANKFLRLPAHIMSLSAEGTGTKLRGIGIQFAHLTEHDIAQIHHFVSEGHRQGQKAKPQKLRASFEKNQKRHECEVFDLSLTGCYLTDLSRVLEPGDKVGLLIELHEGDTLDTVVEVMWLPEDATIVAVTNTRGAAVEFRNLSKQDAQRITARLAETPTGS